MKRKRLGLELALKMSIFIVLCFGLTRSKCILRGLPQKVSGVVLKPRDLKEQQLNRIEAIPLYGCVSRNCFVKPMAFC